MPPLAQTIIPPHVSRNEQTSLTQRRALTKQEHSGLDGVLDLHPRVTSLTFDDMPTSGTLRVEVHGPANEITETNNVTEITNP